MRDYNLEYKDTQERQYNYQFDDIMRKFMIRTFKPYMMPGSALEMGCYKGEFTRHLARHYDNLTVIEASDELAAHTRNRLEKPAKFIVSTFEQVELDRQFDTIYLMHTLEHIDDPVLVMQKVNEWLNETGRFFLIVPNANAPSRQIAVKMGLISHNTAITASEASHGHRRTYTLDTLERDAVAAGMNVVSRGGVFFKPFANFQFDKMLENGIIDDGYLEGCYKLGQVYPDLCASIYVICEKG